MSHFKAKMHQIIILSSVRPSVRLLDGVWDWAGSWIAPFGTVFDTNLSYFSRAVGDVSVKPFGYRVPALPMYRHGPPPVRSICTRFCGSCLCARFDWRLCAAIALRHPLPIISIHATGFVRYATGAHLVARHKSTDCSDWVYSGPNVSYEDCQPDVGEWFGFEY